MLRKIPLRHRLLCAALIALAGLLVAANISLHDSRFLGRAALLRCAFAGAWVSGLVFAGCFGLPGRKGWIYAALAFVGATVLGGIVGVAIMPLDGLVFENQRSHIVRNSPDWSLYGPVYVANFVVTKANVTLAWAAGLAGVHVAARRVTCP